MPVLGSLEIGPYTVGNVPPPVVVTFRDNYGNPIDLIAAGYTSAKWVVRRHAVNGYPDFTSSDPAAVVRSGSILDQTTNKGQAMYAWQAADFDTAGFYEAQMWAGTLAGGKLASVRYIWQVVEAVGTPNF